MAKSIYDILKDCKTETSVPATGKNIEHEIPRNLFPTDEQFESEQALLAWATETKCLHACLQKGIQKALIDIRAAFKSCKKEEVWTPELGQKNVAGWTWDITTRPNTGGSSTARIKAQAELDAAVKIAKAMKLAGLSDEMITSTLTPTYGADTTEEIIAQIN